MNDGIDILLTVDVACMAQSTVNGELNKFAVTEEICCAKETLESSRGTADGDRSGAKGTDEDLARSRCFLFQVREWKYNLSEITNIMLVNNIKFCLNFFCLNVRKNVSPGVRSALVGQVARLQVLGDLINKHTKTESLANDLSTGNREVGNSRSKGNSSCSQKADSKTSEGSADCFKVEFTWVALVVSSRCS
jgi:hypothetical protein